MPYEHNQSKGINKNHQNDTKLLCSSNLAIILRRLLCRQFFRNKITKRVVENTTGNKRQVKGKHSLFISRSWAI